MFVNWSSFCACIWTNYGGKGEQVLTLFLFLGFGLVGDARRIHMGFQKRKIGIFWTLCECARVCVDKLEGYVVITGSRRMQFAERADL